VHVLLKRFPQEKRALTEHRLRALIKYGTLIENVSFRIVQKYNSINLKIFNHELCNKHFKAANAKR
jgi:hypothetical protein